jgi:hypothetical protein
MPPKSAALGTSTALFPLPDRIGLPVKSLRPLTRSRDLAAGGGGRGSRRRRVGLTTPSEPVIILNWDQAVPRSWQALVPFRWQATASVLWCSLAYQVQTAPCTY